MASSNKGFSANQLKRALRVQLNTAWFMAHRIRLAIAGNDGSPFGEGGSVVELDET
jgi:hypothetical protein